MAWICSASELELDTATCSALADPKFESLKVGYQLLVARECKSGSSTLKRNFEQFVGRADVDQLEQVRKKIKTEEVPAAGPSPQTLTDAMEIESSPSVDVKDELPHQRPDVQREGQTYRLLWPEEDVPKKKGEDQEPSQTPVDTQLERKPTPPATPSTPLVELVSKFETALSACREDMCSQMAAHRLMEAQEVHVSVGLSINVPSGPSGSFQVQNTSRHLH